MQGIGEVIMRTVFMLFGTDGVPALARCAEVFATREAAEARQAELEQLEASTFRSFLRTVWIIREVKVQE